MNKPTEMDKNNELTTKSFFKNVYFVYFLVTSRIQNHVFTYIYSDLETNFNLTRWYFHKSLIFQEFPSIWSAFYLDLQCYPAHGPKGKRFAFFHLSTDLSKPPRITILDKSRESMNVIVSCKVPIARLSPW